MSRRQAFRYTALIAGFAIASWVQTATTPPTVQRPTPQQIQQIVQRPTPEEIRVAQIRAKLDALKLQPGQKLNRNLTADELRAYPQLLDKVYADAATQKAAIAETKAQLDSLRKSR
jgi:hypothetical protein